MVMKVERNGEGESGKRASVGMKGGCGDER